MMAKRKRPTAEPEPVVESTGIYKTTTRTTKTREQLRWLAEHLRDHSEPSLIELLQEIEGNAARIASDETATHEVRHDAKHVRRKIDDLRTCIKASDIGLIVADAFDLGRLVERVEVRSVEPFVRNARERINNGKLTRKSAGEKRKAERETAVAAEIERQREFGERINYGAACKAVADAEGLDDSRVIQRDVPNQWTSRRCRKRNT